MGTLVVDSPFYSRPVEEEDAIPRSELAPASAESRVVDFKYRESNGIYNVKRTADKIKDAKRLQSLLDPPQAFPRVANGSQTKITADPDLHESDRLL